MPLRVLLYLPMTAQHLSTRYVFFTVVILIALTTIAGVAAGSSGADTTTVEPTESDRIDGCVVNSIRGVISSTDVCIDNSGKTPEACVVYNWGMTLVCAPPS